MKNFIFSNNVNLNKYDLKVVVLKTPYNNFDTNAEVQSLLSNIFKLKLTGYKAHYPYGILPISDLDFIGNHVCLCLQENNNLIPITAFKSVKKSACDRFQVPFPVVNHKFGMWKNNFQEFVDGINNWTESVLAEGRQPAYNASWTMDINLNKELRSLAREISMSLFYFYYNEEGITDVINSTSAKHNVNLIQENMGLEYLKDMNGEKLGTFNSPIFFQEPFYLMYLGTNGFSDNFSNECNKYASLWENRLEIDNAVENDTIKKAA